MLNGAKLDREPNIDALTDVLKKLNDNQKVQMKIDFAQMKNSLINDEQKNAFDDLVNK